MSSLAATQADGYYLPVEYFESGAYKRKSKNHFQDPSAARVNNSTVRFELPYPAFCSNCETFIQRGTRYNATKLKTDQSYFTTAILEFRMVCRACCSQEFVIRTNPASRGFDYISGIQRKRRDEPETELASSPGHVAEPLGPLQHLESFTIGEQQAITETERLKLIQKSNETKYRDDALRNADIRASFRAERRDRKRSLQAGAALGWKEGLALVATSTDNDIAISKGITYGDCKRRERRQFRKLREASIFKSHRKTVGNSIRDSSDSSNMPDLAPSSSVSLTKKRRGKRGDNPTVDLTVKEEEPTKSKKAFILTGSGLQPESKVEHRVFSCSAIAALAAYESESD